MNLAEIGLAIAVVGLTGLVVMLTYSLTWRTRPRLRHALAWPVVLGCMFWGFRLPRWLR